MKNNRIIVGSTRKYYEAVLTIKDLEGHTGESPQLPAFGQRVDSDLSVHSCFCMSTQKQKGQSGKRSTRLTTSAARHAAIDKILNTHFKTWGLTGTIEPIQRLQDFYISYAIERGVKPVFMADMAFRTAIITRLICSLYEKKEVGNG